VVIADRKEVRGNCRTLYNEELHNLYEWCLVKHRDNFTFFFFFFFFFFF
jgi:hypothetical protein